MDALTGPALVTSALLALAGAQKVVDPAMTVGALRALRLPSSPALVRAGSALELALGVAAAAVGGPVLWALVAASYLAFGGFVLAALRSGTMIGSCGCFGREETPPHAVHLALDVGLAAVAIAAALGLEGGIVDQLGDEPFAAAVTGALSLLGCYLVYVAFVELPRTFAAAAAVRSASE